MKGMAATKQTFFSAMVLTLLLTGCDEGADTIGPRGGTVTSPDGRVTLEVRAGALEHEVFATIGELDEDRPDGAISRVYEIEPRLQQLRVPATLTFDLAVPEVDGAETLDLEAVQMEDLAVVTHKAESWDRLADREVDAERETVSGSVVFFSAYTVAVVE